MSFITKGLGGTGATVERLLLRGLESGEVVLVREIAEAKYLACRRRHAQLDSRSRQRRLDDR